MAMEDSLKSLSMDCLNLLINGQAFSDVTFRVEGRLVHAHRSVLAARSLFFRNFFCGAGAGRGGGGSAGSPDPLLQLFSPRSPSGSASSPGAAGQGEGGVIPVNSVSYEVFLLVLQFLYSGQVPHEPRPNCGERGCWHTHCASAVDLALDTLSAARAFGIDQLAMLLQKQLESVVEKASIEDVMRVLAAARKHDMRQLWATCSHLVARSGLPPEVLAKHLPMEAAAKVEELRLTSSLACRRSPFLSHHHLQQQQQQPQPQQYHFPIGTAPPPSEPDGGHHHHHQRIRRMCRALDSSDVELVKLMVMGEGLDLDEALALHYAVRNCSREVVKALLELGAADVNLPAGPRGKSPLHVAAEMVCPDMVAVLLDHHADPCVRTVDGVTPLDVLRALTSEFLFKGAVPGLAHVEPNKLRLCLELVQSAAAVLSRAEAAETAGNCSDAGMYPQMSPVQCDADRGSGRGGGDNGGMVSLSLDPRMVYLNLGGNRSHGSGGIGSVYDYQ